MPGEPQPWDAPPARGRGSGGRRGGGSGRGGGRRAGGGVGAGGPGSSAKLAAAADAIHAAEGAEQLLVLLRELEGCLQQRLKEESGEGGQRDQGRRGQVEGRAEGQKPQQAGQGRQEGGAEGQAWLPGQRLLRSTAWSESEAAELLVELLTVAAHLNRRQHSCSSSSSSSSSSFSSPLASAPASTAAAASTSSSAAIRSAEAIRPLHQLAIQCCVSLLPLLHRCSAATLVALFGALRELRVADTQVWDVWTRARQAVLTTGLQEPRLLAELIWQACAIPEASVHTSTTTGAPGVEEGALRPGSADCVGLQQSRLTRHTLVTCRNMGLVDVRGVG